MSLTYRGLDDDVATAIKIAERLSAQLDQLRPPLHLLQEDPIGQAMNDLARLRVRLRNALTGGREFANGTEYEEWLRARPIF